MDIKNEVMLDTGDLILFRGNSWISWFIEWFGWSRYSHVGIILKNPKFLNHDLEDGLYLLESSFNNIPDAENHIIKTGVQINRLDDILKLSTKGSVFVRKINTNRDELFYEKLDTIHKEIHNKPYDFNIYDWLCAKYNLMCEIPVNSKYKSTKNFWCSALVSYIYCELGLIDNNINWSLIAPREYSSTEGKYIKFLCDIDNEKLLY